MRVLLRRCSAGFVLAGFHSVHVLWTWWWVATHPGFLIDLNWLPVALIDFPLVALIEATGADGLLGGGPTVTGLTLLLGGGLYWLLIGFALQAAWRRFLRRLEWG
ncbi:MAG TPA: hypothetical protein VF170_18180 [Planctomycetaceae bacterium]